MKSTVIRQKFLDFFSSKSHQIVPSAPLVLKDDPTLMFTNAGMNPFKEYFLGNVKPSSNRIADTQKCLRVSGKHNDLEEVGIDTYHHTFFEMLGNWSFGDYFKKEAIFWAWELLTEIYKIDPDKLYVTIFEGATDEKLEKDNESYDLWKKIIPEDRILLGSKKDNFWEMGDQGPCGPCSEIHIDIRNKEERSKISGANLVNKDHPHVIEVWNLVFIEFNRKADGTLEKLPNKHVDTGMGFERLCMVLQGKKSNYDTDVFIPLISEIENITNTKYGESEKTDRAIRVIADHIRTVYFSIADGQLPSNNGAGYVIRRILRRAIRYGFTFLKQKKPFIHLLTKTLSEQMGDSFKELLKEQKLALNVIKEEENSFLKTLEQGLDILEDVIKNSVKGKISGDKVFELYDTFGFPFDLTALVASEKGYKIDQEGFNIAMEKQKSRSREAALLKAGDWVLLSDSKKGEFIGYDKLKSKIKISRYRKISTSKDGDFFHLVFDKTPFYPEGGGQVGDNGYIESSNGDIFRIFDTKKENSLLIHYCKTLPNKLENNFTAVVDSNNRYRSSCNHTATHLMHQALRSILGSHVEQKGSMVNSEMFRFDFSHYSKLSEEELRKVEQFVNDRVLEKIPLNEYRDIDYNEALKKGAIALFGEKYGDKVRAIQFDQSIELCGGTHVSNTSEIWYFKIISETAVASGIRRIEAITGDAAKKYFEEQTQLIESIKNILKQTQEPLKAIQNIQNENTVLKKELISLSKMKLQLLKSELIKDFENISGIQFLAREVELNAKEIKEISFEIGLAIKNSIIVLGSSVTGKPILSCYISKSIVESRERDAIKIIKKLGKYIDGSGGGQTFFATAGGKNLDGISGALRAAKGICFS